MKKIFGLILTVSMLFTVAGTSVTAQNQEDQKTYRMVYVAKSLSNPLFVLYQKGMEETIKKVNEEAGYEKIVFEAQTTANESDVEQMLTLCDTLLTQDIDALLITPASSTSFSEIAKRCNNKEIPLINLDTLIDQEELDAIDAHFDVFVGNDNVQMGRDLYQAVMDAFEESCRYIVIGGYEGASTHIDIMKGFREKQESGPDTMEQIDYQAADWNRNKAFEIASSLLTAHPDVEAFVCFNDQMASGCIEAMEAIGKVPGEDIKVFGSTFVGDAQQNIYDGRQYFSISRMPFTVGTIAMEQAINLCEGREVSHPDLKGNIIEIVGRTVTKEDLVLKDGVFYDTDGVMIENW